MTTTDLCIKIFINAWHAKRHTLHLIAWSNIYYHHAKKVKQYHCKRCDLSFPFKSQLKIHSMKHTRKPSFEYTECSLPFKYHHDMLKHLKEHTAPEISCNSWDYRGTKLNLKAHEKQNDPTQRITCTQCKDTFRFRISYWRHKKLCKRSGSPEYWN